MSGLRTWISRSRTQTADSARCVVWVELGGGRLLWILENGECGVSHDNPQDGIYMLSKNLARSCDWELVT